MAAWTDYLALMASFASGKAFTDEKAQALAENVAALAEGAANAPRILLPALERLIAGTSIRLRSDTAVVLTGSTFTSVGIQPCFLQAGTVRIAFEHRTNGAGNSEVRVIRRRAGTSSILTTISQSGTTYVAKTYDVDVQPGDKISMQHRNTSGADSDIRNIRLQVDAATYYWPAGDAQFGEVEGNPTITSP